MRLRLVTSRDPMRTSPDCGLRSPAMIRSNVDLPDPPGPMIAVWVVLGKITAPKVASVTDMSSIESDSFTRRRGDAESYGPARYATCTTRLRSRTFYGFTERR